MKSCLTSSEVILLRRLVLMCCKPSERIFVTDKEAMHRDVQVVDSEKVVVGDTFAFEPV